MNTMSKKHVFLALFCLFLSPPIFSKESIKAICFDIETLFETENAKAANYIGKIDSLRYLKQVGHLPCQADLFKFLANVPAQSTFSTYNNDLKMPLILADWLVKLQPATSLLTETLTFIKNSRLSEIEKKVFGNIVTMMLTPTSLIDTQKVIRPTEALVASLKKKGYQLFLVGNWAHLDSLQQNFGKNLQAFNGVFVSGKLHLLKPSKEFYTTILENINLDSAHVLWIEKESNFLLKAKEYNLQMIRYNTNQPKSIEQDLKSFNVNI